MIHAAETAFVYFCCMAVAIGSLSWAWSAFKRMMDAPSFWVSVEAIFAPASLFISAFLLLLCRYAYGKSHGTITHEVPLFERWLRKRSG